MRNPKIIILNGRQYDAITGKPVSGPMQDIIKPSLANPKPLPGQASTKQFIDNFSTAANLAPKSEPPKPISSGGFVHPHHHRAEDAKRVQLKSKTLMRQQLNKPSLAPQSIVQPIRKSSYVKRGDSPILNRTFVPDSVRSSVVASAQTIKDKAAEVVSNLSAEPAVVTNSVHDRIIQKIEESSDDQLYQVAASNMDESKVQKKPKKSSKKRHFRIKTLYISGGILLLLLILVGGGFYFKYNIELSYANERTGISGSLPKYLPLGYKLSKFTYYKTGNSGSIILEYHPVHSLLSKYLYINEAGSNLDNGGLLATEVTPVAHNNFETISVNGLSVYHFGNQFVWVNAGMLYVMTDQTGLNQETITKIISSI